MKRVLVLAMGVPLMAGVAGCKKEKKAANEAPPQEAKQPETAPPPEPTPPPEEKPAAAESPDSQVEMSGINLAEVKWVEPPPMLPKGAMLAVLEGTPPFADAKTFTVLVKMPKNYTIPPHTHPAIERLTLLSGSLMFGHGDKVDKKAAKPLKTGGTVIIPANHPHWVTTSGEVVGMLHGIGPLAIDYIDPKDDPRQPPPPKSTAAASPFDGALQDPIVANPGDLKWADVPAGVLPPGAKMAVVEGTPPFEEAKEFTVRMKFPKNYKIPVHTHPSTERVTVISGTPMFGMSDTWDDKAMKPYKPGAVIVLPKDHKHYLMTKSETVVQINAVGPFKIVWANPADDPANAAKGGEAGAAGAGGEMAAGDKGKDKDKDKGKDSAKGKGKGKAMDKPEDGAESGDSKP